MRKREGSRRKRNTDSSNLILKGIGLGCLLFFLFISTLKLSSTIMKKSLGNAPVKRLKMAIRIDPFDEETWFTLGKVYYYLGHYDMARNALDKSLSSNCLYSPAWVDKMWLNINENGNIKDASHIVQILDLLHPTNIALHWKILTRMLALESPWSREVALREIKILLPLESGRKTKLFKIANLILKNDRSLLTFVPDEESIKKQLVLYFLYDIKRPDLALILWDEINERGWKDEDILKIMVNGLFRNRRYQDAFTLWKKNFKTEYNENLIFNGGFEKDFLRFGFAWRTQRKIPGMKRARFVHFYKSGGRRSFSMEFDGEHNPSVMNPYQYIYLYPGHYVFTAFLSTEDLSGANGFYLEISGPKFRKISKGFKGDTDWTKIELDISLKAPGLYRVSFRRNATKKLNRFLGGKVFLDEVKLIKVNE